MKSYEGFSENIAFTGNYGHRGSVMPIKTIKKAIRFVLNNIHFKKVDLQVTTLSPNELLKGRTAYITGGTSGIGYEIAYSFLKSGCNVIITGRSIERVENACEALKQKEGISGSIIGLVADSCQTEKFQSHLNSALSKLKSHNISDQIDILVNNAGIVGGKLPLVTGADFDNIIYTNLKAPFFLSYIFADYMKQNHIKGNILNIGSSSSHRPAISAYTLSKWGVRALTLGLAKSYAPYGITVNGLAPGPTSTPMLQMENNSVRLNKAIPLGRYIMPEEIANMAVILVSPLARAIIGDMVFMTGGVGNLTFDDYDYSL